MNPAVPREDRLAIAVILMLITFLSFSLLDTGAKLLVLAGLPLMQVAFVRYLTHFIMAIVFFFPRYGTQIFKSNLPGLQILRAFTLLGATLFNFAALAYLPLTVTTAIAFSAPLMVCLLSHRFLNETVGLRRLMAIFVGFFGVLVTTQIWNENFHWAMFLSIGSPICFSIYIVITRKIAGADDNPVSQIYASGIATMLLAPFGYLAWTNPSTPQEWGILLAVGVVGAIGHSILTLAHRYAPASKLAPLIYVQIIYVTIISWLVFNTTPDFWTIVGTGIIVASGLFVWFRERMLRARTSHKIA